MQLVPDRLLCGFMVSLGKSVRNYVEVTTDTGLKSALIIHTIV